MKYLTLTLFLVVGMTVFSAGTLSAQYKSKLDAYDTVERHLKSLYTEQPSLNTKLTNSNSIDEFEKEDFYSDLVLSLFGEKLLENLGKAPENGLDIYFVVKTTYNDLELSQSESFLNEKLKAFEIYLEKLKI